MKLKYTLGIILLVISQHAYCQRSQPDGSSEPSNSNSLDVVANSVTNLAQKISRAIVSQRSKTEIFSPVSIAGALSLLLLGSGGTTRSELMDLMGFSSEQINFTDIHKGFGKLFRELVSNDPSVKANVPWRENDKCNNIDYEDDDFMSSRGSFHSSAKGSRPRRDADNYVDENNGNVSIGNGVFAQQGQNFDEKYELLAKQLYQSAMKFLDFANNPQKAVAFINDWVRVQTRGKIPEIVSHLDGDTLLVIANTLYFKGEWEEPFLKDGTKLRKFFPNGPKKASSDVMMMVHGGCFPYYYWKEADVRVLGIPYKKNYTMYILMPTDSDRSKLVALHDKINASIINEIIGKMEVKTVSIQLPKMHMLNSFSLKQVLEQLGASSIFDRHSSDLTRILAGSGSLSRVDTTNVEDILDWLGDTKENAENKLREEFSNCVITEKDVDTKETCEKDPRCRFGGDTCVCCSKFGFRRRREAGYQRLFVNEVIHKVDVVINEKGTEGGAVTATLLDRITPQVNFRANGPFLLLIRDEATKLPLFYGSVYDPSN
ncbi:serine protease inhibitor 28Dc-like isoform X3 [Topomyia yanbarensis]|uniref:serine protease inhibitor 28Dc-like isoform X3 n=1 Tax=Topomyia yanbarensis TaxID=2498891 RepID=UPI00273B67A5|nr:serine protease inhibitor 28Dc-like isoform X3 [Topomyia yanbarensis]